MTRPPRSSTESQQTGYQPDDYVDLEFNPCRELVDGGNVGVDGFLLLSW
jgi:hypothetical protein